MAFIKNYRNLIILIIIVIGIMFSTNIIEFASKVANKVEKIFSASKPDYSNLSSKGYKVQSSSKSTSASKPQSGASTSQNKGAKSMFKKDTKEPSPEELDKQIMEQNSDETRRRELFKKSTRQFDEGVNQNKMADEKFNMDMKKEFEDF